jgi:hypothetical protein
MRVLCYKGGGGDRLLLKLQNLIKGNGALKWGKNMLDRERR